MYEKLHGTCRSITRQTRYENNIIDSNKILYLISSRVQYQQLIRSSRNIVRLYLIDDKPASRAFNLSVMSEQGL